MEVTRPACQSKFVRERAVWPSMRPGPSCGRRVAVIELRTLSATLANPQYSFNDLLLVHHMPMTMRANLRRLIDLLEEQYELLEDDATKLQSAPNLFDHE